MDHLFSVECKIQTTNRLRVLLSHEKSPTMPPLRSGVALGLRGMSGYIGQLGYVTRFLLLKTLAKIVAASTSQEDRLLRQNCYTIRQLRATRTV